jgi:hypothetical protein
MRTNQRLSPALLCLARAGVLTGGSCEFLRGVGLPRSGSWEPARARGGGRGGSNGLTDRSSRIQLEQAVSGPGQSLAAVLS